MEKFVELNSWKLPPEKYSTGRSVEPVRKLIGQQRNANFTEYKLVVENIMPVERLSYVLTASWALKSKNKIEEDLSREHEFW